jgi:cytochrome P450
VNTTLSLDDEVLRFLSSSHPDRAALRRDPYPFYDRLRSRAPVIRAELGPWLVTSYDAVNRLVRANRWTRESSVPEEDLSVAERVFLRSLVFRDPPAHTRLRRILSPLFTASVIERRRQRTRAIARELLDDLRSRDTFDFRRDFASELPVRLICEFIGMPLDARQQFEGWAHTVRDLQELAHETESAEQSARRSSIAVPARTVVLERANKTAAQCLAYFEALLKEKRAAPGEDITSMLLATSESDEAPLTTEEIVATLIILHVGGHSTTTDAISTGQYTLFRHPMAQNKLRADPRLVERAVEEMLRFDPPVTVGIPRFAPCGLRVVWGHDPARRLRLSGARCSESGPRSIRRAERV